MIQTTDTGVILIAILLGIHISTIYSSTVKAEVVCLHTGRNCIKEKKRRIQTIHAVLGIQSQHFISFVKGQSGLYGIGYVIHTKTWWRYKEVVLIVINYILRRFTLPTYNYHNWFKHQMENISPIRDALE